MKKVDIFSKSLSAEDVHLVRGRKKLNNNSCVASKHAHIYRIYKSTSTKKKLEKRIKGTVGLGYRQVV
jgi:hypothetical protein